MANLNKVLLMGNLTTDPEVKYTPKGTAVGDLRLAINDSYKAQDGTIKETVTYVDVEVWDARQKRASSISRRGRGVFVEGQLRLDQWEQDGQKRSKLKVRADRVQFLGGVRAAAVVVAVRVAIIPAAEVRRRPVARRQRGPRAWRKTVRRLPRTMDDIPF